MLSTVGILAVHGAEDVKRIRFCDNTLSPVAPPKLSDVTDPKNTLRFGPPVFIWP